MTAMKREMYRLHYRSNFVESRPPTDGFRTEPSQRSIVRKKDHRVQLNIVDLFADADSANTEGEKREPSHPLRVSTDRTF
jgi:hypothetical protein